MQQVTCAYFDIVHTQPIMFQPKSTFSGLEDTVQTITLSSGICQFVPTRLEELSKSSMKIIEKSAAAAAEAVKKAKLSMRFFLKMHKFNWLVLT